MNKIGKFFKKNFKLIIGIAVLILTISMFFVAQYKAENLESANLQKWTESSKESKITAVQVLAPGTQDTDLIVQCVDKMSTFNDSAEFKVSDAVKLCNMGIQLRENN